MKKVIVDHFIIPKYNKNGNFLRPICSFKYRNRPIKKKNILFLKKYWKLYGIDFQMKYINTNIVFKRNNLPVILDIGFGTGESLIYTGLNFIECNIIGIEVYLTGIINTIKKINSINNINNIKIIAHDIIEVLQYMICDHSISVIQIFFPDPWRKSKHHKRRLINQFFVNILQKKLIHGGLLHIITDCVLYYTSIINIINDIDCFINISHYYHVVDIVHYRNITKFAKKSQSRNSNIFNLVFQYIQIK